MSILSDITGVDVDIGGAAGSIISAPVRLFQGGNVFENLKSAFTQFQSGMQELTGLPAIARTDAYQTAAPYLDKFTLGYAGDVGKLSDATGRVTKYGGTFDQSESDAFNRFALKTGAAIGVAAAAPAVPTWIGANPTNAAVAAAAIGSGNYLGAIGAATGDAPPWSSLLPSPSPSQPGAPQRTISSPWDNNYTSGYDVPAAQKSSPIVPLIAIGIMAFFVLKGRK